jgi:hypothetical protein
VPTKTEKTAYGYTSAISGTLTPPEAAAWFEEVKRAVGSTHHAFHQLIDLRGQKPNPPQSQAIVEQAMGWVREQGMVRSAVVLSDTIMRMQIMRLAKEVGMYAYERYFDASKNPNWQKEAMAWIEQGVDPDTH